MKNIDFNKIYNEDCLGNENLGNGMRRIPGKTVDMILCDLPYGTTARNKWDTIIPFEPLWQEYERVIKDNGAIVLFGSQPFTSELIISNKKFFKYEIVWDKVNIGNPLNAKKMPLKSHENILVFYKKQPTYNPQMTDLNSERTWKQYASSSNFNELKEGSVGQTKGKYPKSILKISNANRKDKIHPTQKPVELCEWLIKTYTNEGETVLDNCMGSGSTAIACINTQRNYIGFELDKKYHRLAEERIHNHVSL